MPDKSRNQKFKIHQYINYNSKGHETFSICCHQSTRQYTGSLKSAFILIFALYNCEFLISWLARRCTSIAHFYARTYKWIWCNAITYCKYHSLGRAYPSNSHNSAVISISLNISVQCKMVVLSRCFVINYINIHIIQVY